MFARRWRLLCKLCCKESECKASTFDGKRRRRMWSGGAQIEASAARLADYWRALISARWPLLGWVFVCAAAGAAYFLLLPAQFVARVDVVIGPRAFANDGPEDVRHFHQVDIDAQQAATELWVMGSDLVLRRVFDDLALGDLPELTSGADGLLPLVARWAHRLAPGSSPYDEHERAYFAFASRVLCLRVGGSYVFELSYRSRDPRLAVRVANALASAYLSDRLNRERQRREGVAAYQVQRSDELGREILSVRMAEKDGLIPAQDMYSAGARILGPALPPQGRTFPKPVPTLLLSVAIGLISGVVAILSGAGATAAPGARRAGASDVRGRDRLAESLD